MHFLLRVLQPPVQPISQINTWYLKTINDSYSSVTLVELNAHHLTKIVNNDKKVYYNKFNEVSCSYFTISKPATKIF